MDVDLLIEVNACGARVQTKSITGISEVSRSIGQPVVGGVPRPVTAGCILGNCQSISLARSQIPSIVVEGIRAGGGAGACRPDAGEGGVDVVDVGHGGNSVGALDRHSLRGGRSGRLAGVQRVMQRIARTGGVGADDQVVVPGGQGGGQLIDGFVNHDRAAVQRGGDGGFIARVVADKDRHGIGFGGEGIGHFFPGGGLLGHDVHISRGAGGVHHAQVRDILIIADVQGDSAVAVQDRRADLGRFVIHGHGVADIGALAVVAGGEDIFELGGGQREGLVVAVRLIGVILGEGKVTEGNLLVLRCAERADGSVEALRSGARVLPRGRCGLRVEERGGLVRTGSAGIEHSAVLIHNGQRGAGGGADQIITDLIEQRVVGEGELFDREGGFLHVGVAEIPRGIGGAVITDLPAVGIGRAEVGGLVGAVNALFIAHGVEHGGVRPGAVEAEHRDGVGHVVVALDEGERFNVGAARAFGVQRGLLRVGKLDGHGDGTLAVRRNDLILLARFGRAELGKQNVSVAGGNAVHAVELGSLEVIGGAVRLAGNVFEDRVGVRLIGVPVLIHVGGEVDGRSVIPRIGHVGGKRRGGVLHQGLVGGERLREHVGAQGVFDILIGEVVDLKGIGVFTAAGGIVAELRLDLIVVGGHGGGVVHLNKGLGVHGGLQVRKTRALLEQRIVVAGFLFHHGRRGGHEGARDEVAAGKTRLGSDVLILEVLAEGSGETGDLRRGHGGTGHELILGVSSGVAGAALVLMVAVQGLDASAGRSDLGLEGQRTGHAPGGEVAHLVVSERRRLGSGVDLDGAGIIGNAAGGGRRVIRADHVAHALLDARNGAGVGIALNRHAAQAPGGVVDDQHALGARLERGIRLHREVGGTAVAQRDLAVDHALDRVELVVGGRIVRTGGGVAGAVDVNELIRARDAGQLGAGGARHVVLDVHVAEMHQRRSGAGVVDGGDGEGIVEGTGGTAGHEVHVVRIELLLRVPGGVVAHGDGQNELGILKVVEDGHIGRGGFGGNTGKGRTERQVCRGRAETDRVFHSGHIVRIVGAAAHAEDLHDEDLRIGRFADHADALGGVDVGRAALEIAVCRGNTGDVRAVLAAGVLLVRDVGVAVHVVINKRQLGGLVNTVFAVERARLDGRDLRGGEQIDGLAVGAVLGDRVIERVGVHGLMVDIKTGVDDRQSLPGAVIVGGVAEIRAHHIAGVRHLGGIRLGRSDGRFVTALDLHALHAVKGFDGGDIAVADVRRDGVGEQGQVPLDVDGAAGGRFDLRLDGGLIAAQGLLIGGGRGVDAHALHGVACVTRGGLRQEDRHTHGVVQPVGQFFVRDRILRFHFADLRDLQSGRIDRGGRKLDRSVVRSRCRHRRDHDGEEHEHGKKNRKELFRV